MTTQRDYDAARHYGSAILDAVSAFGPDRDGHPMDLASQRALLTTIGEPTGEDDDVIIADARERFFVLVPAMFFLALGLEGSGWWVVAALAYVPLRLAIVGYLNRNH